MKCANARKLDRKPEDAGANMGHPSRSLAVVLYQGTTLVGP